jgi:transposase
VCKECNRHFYEQFSFVDSKESVTNRYGERLYALCQGVELQYVVVRENLCWQTVNRIVPTYGQRKINQKQAFAKVSRLGIDEIALKKGHKDYVAVIVDLDTGQVLDLLEDRTKQSLVNYFQAKGAACCAQIQLFCSDLWEGYVNTAKEVFPQAVIVADRFHFFSRLPQALDNCRRYLRRKYPKADELKQIKWLLLKNPSRLTAAQKQQLECLFAQPDYQLLKATYQAKNTFRDILESDLDRQQAQHRMQAWLLEIEQTANRFLTDFVKFYTTWKNYILNYFLGRYTTGSIEGINNKIKSIKRRAFGFSNFNNFKLRIQAAFS